MKGLSWTALCGLVAVLQLCSSAKPNGGKFSRITQVLVSPASGEYGDKSENNAVCSSLTLYDEGQIYLKMTGKTSNKKKSARVYIVVSVIRSECANIQHCDLVTKLGSRIHNETSFLFLYDLESLATHDMIKSSPGSIDGLEKKETTTNTTATKYCNGSASGLYIVYIESYVLGHPKDITITLTFTLEMKNFYGYLSAIDYPALVSYGVMTAVYATLGVIWSLAMCCSPKYLVRLHFWILSVIILCFLEEVFFLSEYSSINSGEDSFFLLLLAVVMSVVRRSFARVLLLIISFGFGTVRHRLGVLLWRTVVAVGSYCIFAFIDEFVRARAEIYDTQLVTQDTLQMLTLAVLFVIDSFIFYWICVSQMRVQKALRLTEHYVKLSMYKHFWYTLIFAIIAAVAFTIWVSVEIIFPEGGCLKNWQEVWLQDCFWHFLFCFFLIVIMIIWRPSANKDRFFYSLVNDLEQGEEDDEIEEKFFETVKMKTVSRDGGTPPPVSTQVEDDMKLVEENLPTTAMDKALPPDSDEEVIFEASMN